MKKLSVFTATLFGVGYFPIFPGTAASFLTTVLIFVFPSRIQIMIETDVFCLVIGILLFLISVIVCDEAEKELGKDNRKIVLDEFWGMIIASLFLPKTLVNIAIAFILFRVFDILKFWPIKLVEKLPGGLGIMTDDILAGILANVGVRLFIYIM
jgi:phosphatidylglycerophosphatase A